MGVTKVLLYLAVPVTLIGVVLLITGYSLTKSNDRKIGILEGHITSREMTWLEDFASYLIKQFSTPCPNCHSKTILAEGVKKEVRTNESPIPNFFDYTLVTIKSFFRFCPNCNRYFDDPKPMEDWTVEIVSQERALAGGEPFTIVQTHQEIDSLIRNLAKVNYSKHTEWNYPPNRDQENLEKQMESLISKAAKYSKFVIWGWILAPMGILLFFGGILIN